MLRSALTALFLFGLWLSMSGVYKPLVVGLGAASALLAVFFVRRMDDAADEDRLAVNVHPIRTVRYVLWLLGEIAKSNIAVTKTILSPQMPIRQHFFKVPYSQKTDLGQAAFANSITLTPGTISVEVEYGYFWVHALNFSDGDMDGLADMDARVTYMEDAA